MSYRIIAVMAILGLVAACETAPKQAGSASGSGASAQQQQQQQQQQQRAQRADQYPRDRLLEIGNVVYFGYDSSALSSESRRTLDAQVAFLRDNPAVKITIEGHCDERGTREYNLALGERRASAVRDYMVAQGIDGLRMRIISYGKERPAVVGSNESAWSQNRRAASIIY